MKADVLNVKGEVVESVSLNNDIFKIEPNMPVVHQYVKAYLANQRQGTQSAKTRAEVRGGGKKPWRQKGTGRARVGSSRNPVWTGGGVAFAPKPRDYSQSINKKMKRLAMKSVFSAKVNDKEFIIILTDGVKIKTNRAKDNDEISKEKENKRYLIAEQLYFNMSKERKIDYIDLRFNDYIIKYLGDSK